MRLLFKRCVHKSSPPSYGGRGSAFPVVCAFSAADAGHGLQYLILLRIESLLHGKALEDVDIDHLSGLCADHAVGLALGKNFDGVRVLGRGELQKKLNVKASGISASAKEKIEAAGGKAEVI